MRHRLRLAVSRHIGQGRQQQQRLHVLEPHSRGDQLPPANIAHIAPRARHGAKLGHGTAKHLQL
eukprot:10957500-Alexandrium_andersonii.AAC.1